MRTSSKIKSIYNLNENKTFSLLNSSRELNYIKHKFKTSFRFTVGKNETILQAWNIVGILDLGSSLYRVYPKVGDVLNIFNMINKVSESNHSKIGTEGYLYLDPSVTVAVEDENNQLTDALIKIFLNELYKVERVGYTKNYKRNTSNIHFLRGKLNTSKHIRKNILGTKFYCSFNELTYNTPENIILFKTIDKILARHKVNKEDRNKLLLYKNDFIRLLDAETMDYVDMDRTKYCKNRTNIHYEVLISIANMILANKFSSSLRHGTSQFCNFMVNTSLLFEQYIFIILSRLIDAKYSNYYLEYQKNINGIIKLDNDLKPIINRDSLKEQSLKMDADIVILEKGTDAPVLIIDTKYVDIYGKNKLPNSVYYQMISYLYAMNAKLDKDNAISAILLAHGDKGNSYKIPNDGCDIYVLTKGIDILGSEENIEMQLDDMISGFLLSKKV